MREIYLDNSATTRCFPEVAERMSQIYLEAYGNPSSMHHKGVEAEKCLREARKTLAGILKAGEKDLLFTSCGTESDNIAIIGGAEAACRRGRHLITTQIEHPAVLEAMRHLEKQGFEVTYLPVDRLGLVDPETVASAVREDTILVSVMHTNNEIGSVQPVAEIGRRIKEKNPKTLFHVDAVQGFGKAQLFPKRMKIDLLSASGHKIHAPKGIGLLYIAPGVRVLPQIYGGGQQGGLRSGTENVAGIAGMALAAEMLYRDLEGDNARLAAMRDTLRSGLTEIEDVHINGPAGAVETAGAAAPHILSVTVAGVRAEVMLHALEDRGVYVSSGSACSTNHPHPSDTLQAIGASRAALDSTIRMSLSVMNTEEEMAETVAVMRELIPMLRRYTRR